MTLEFSTAWLALATTVLAAVAWCQIVALRDQTKGWKTLEVCEKYDLDPVLTKCIQKLDAGGEAVRKEPTAYRLETVTVLNYLDSIAIGIKQNLYVEDIARDQLEPMLIEHVTKHITGADAGVFGIDRTDYATLVELCEKWKERRVRFKA